MLRVAVSKLPASLRNGKTVLSPRRYFWSRRYLFDPSTEVSNVIRQFERRTQEFDRDVSRMFNDISGGFMKWPRSFYYPFALERPVEISPDGNKIFRKQFDIKNLKPEDVKVTLQNRQLVIKGKRADESDGQRYSVEYNYEYTLPEEVNPEELKSLITEDGYLILEAPLPKEEPVKPKEIPIDRSVKN